MITMLRHSYHKIARFKKFFFGIFFVVGIFIATHIIYANNIPFQNLNIFPWINTGYYSNVHFNYGGNNFVGIIFWQSGLDLTTAEQITINGGAQAIQCSQKLQGIYYNPMRGMRIYPLDTGNLSLLQTQASGYTNMTLSKGFFTHCTAVSGGYVPGWNDVYGQIDYSLDGITSNMFAGVAYNFTGNSISGAVFAPTLTISAGGIHSGYLFDTQGGIAELKMNVPWCQNFVSSPSPAVIVPQGSTNISFTCYGQNNSGYMFNLFTSTGTSPFYTSTIITNASSYTWTTGNTLATGSYRATCTILGPSLSGPQCGINIPISVGGTIDTLPPTSPIIVSPTSGAGICPVSIISLLRNGSYDTGGLWGYRYTLYNNSMLSSTGIVLSGVMNSTSYTGTTGINITISGLSGTYYAQVVAVDNAGNVTTGPVSNFTIGTQYCRSGGQISGIVIATPVIWLRNVDLNKVYRSDPIIVLGLTGTTLVSISKGMLFINGTGMGVGNTGYITGGSTLYIEMISSDEYDTTVSSTITIAGQTGTFYLTTKKKSDLDCNLSDTQKLAIKNMYKQIKITYEDNQNKLNDFLYTLHSMLEDEIDLTNDCSLQYMQTLIEEDLYENGGIDTSKHIAPNCKEYTIAYDRDIKGYYSSTMKKRYYFITRDLLVRHIDYYNPGDCHINTYSTIGFRSQNFTDDKHVAPNGKIYHLIKSDGKYTAKEFISAKYFDSLDGIIRYIDIQNPSKTIWNHKIDTSVDPIWYTAPNGKEYKIYKTDKGYMSYKLVSVRYYDSLTAIKDYINKNNPKKK